MERIVFGRGDGGQEIPGPILVFTPSRPRWTRGDALWWARACDPDVIAEVVGLLARHQPSVTVVIGGLSEYPLCERARALWLAELSSGVGPPIRVDTSDLSVGERRRLIRGTRRQLALQRQRRGWMATLHEIRSQWWRSKS